MLFLLKIAVAPLLVAGVSLAARWWGPTVGGLLMGLPWITGPVLLVLVLDRGVEFGVAASIGIELGVICISAFMLAYGLIAAVAPWPLSLAGAVAAFFASALAVTEPSLQPWLMPGAIPPLWAATGLGLASLGAVLVLLPRPRGEVRRFAAPPWWDIPARMATAAGIVTAVLLGADALGPRLAGVLSTYPTIITVVGAFTHHRWGRDAVWRVLRGISASLLGFIAFFLVVGLTLPALGITAAYALAALTALAVTAALLVTHRVRHARAARLAEALRHAP
jgi:hypothetical protein